MKKIYLLFAAMTAMVFNANAQVQTGAGSKVLLDSMYYYSFDSINAQSKEYYSYDDSLRQIRDVTWYWDEDSSKFVMSNDQRTCYAENGKVAYTVSQSPWSNDSVIYSYPATNTEVVVKWLAQSGNALTPCDSTINTYNQKGNIVGIITHYWNTETNQWSAPSFKQEYQYDNTFDVATSSESKMLDEGGSWYTSMKHTTILTSFGKEQLYCVYETESSANPMQITNKDTFMYDNNELLIKMIKYGTFDNGATFEINELDTFIYDNGKLVRKINIADPSYLSSISYTYDQFGNEETVISRINSGSGYEFDTGTHKFYSRHAIPSAVENVNENQKLNEAAKFLRNGQLYIRRGDVIYDAKGTRVE